MDDLRRQTLQLSDGRTLTFSTYGDPDGMPVVFSHGLSDSRVIRNPDDAFTASLGVRMIAADQPGVGGSTPMPGRTMKDWGPDMEQLADHLGLSTFAVAGHSGGGPHALAVAAHLPDRVTHGALASPVGPFDKDGYSTMLTMSDLKLVVKLHRFHHLLKMLYWLEAKPAEKDIGAFLEKTAKSDPSDADTFLANPAQRAMFEQSFTIGLQQDEEGIFEMTMALWDWGFDIGDIGQPFSVFYGEADDIIDPLMPRQLAEQLPSATSAAWPGAGHYGFVDRDRWTQFLQALVDRPSS